MPYAKSQPPNQGSISSRGNSVVGDFVSADQYVVNTPSRLILGCFKQLPHNQFYGGTMFHDAATGLVLAENQVSFRAGETLMANE